MKVININVSIEVPEDKDEWDAADQLQWYFERTWSHYLYTSSLGIPENSDVAYPEVIGLVEER